jgi:hypothetical protein
LPDRRYYLGWTLTFLGLAALVVLIAVPVLLINPFYASCLKQVTTYSQPLLPIQYVDRLILSLGLTLYTGIRLYAAVAAVLLIAGWLLIGTPARHRLGLAATVLFVLGLLMLSWTAINSYSYTANPTWLRTQALQMDVPRQFYSPDEAAAKIWQIANPVPRNVRTEFQLPVLWLLGVQVLMRFVWRLKVVQNST